MPDVREVFEMVTKQKAPEPGALERQQNRQVRAARNKKIGAFLAAAAIGVAAIALILVARTGGSETIPANRPPAVNPEGAAPVKVATGFLTAFGDFDAEQAKTYLAEGADLTGMTEGKGVEGLPLMTAFFKAQGYEQMLDSCEETGSSTSVTYLRCTFDWHGIRSDEIGLGPYSGSYFDLTVSSGEVVQASMYLEIEKFSPQMWEPFRDWVSTTYPKDFTVMYKDGGSNFVLSEESIRLWEQRTREYVKEVNRGTAGQ